MKFVAELPPGYDERTRLYLTEDNEIVASHPEHPTLILDEKSRTFVRIVRRLSDC